MPPLVILLVVVAAVAHATWNLTIKAAGTSGTRFLWLTFVIATVVVAPFGIVSLTQLRGALPLLLLLAVGSGGLQIAYFLTLQRGYRIGDVSIVYPLARGSGPLLSVIFAIILFGEHPGVWALAGAGLVIVGVVVIGLAGGRGRLHANRRGILWGLLVGITIAAYTLWDANAVVQEKLPPLGYFWITVVVQLVAFAPFALRQPKYTIALAKQHWAAALVVGILSPLAYVLILFAFTLAPVALVAPAREASVVLVALGGWLLFKEPHPVQRMLGALVVLGGVALLALG
ncbi:MAG TPA: EamA family transporter [Galbitalea sp.]|nr:EamA family transporter [Galbitalea sp.]